MTIRSYQTIASVVAFIVVTCATPAQALTMKECSVKYRAAQAAGALKGMTWNEFRKSECGSNATMPSAAATTPADPKARRSHSPSAASGNPIFPTAISPKYARESAGKARMHTCLDQYKANKASDANGNLKWTQKGGGYYSECNKKLVQQ